MHNQDRSEHSLLLLEISDSCVKCIPKEQMYLSSMLLQTACLDKFMEAVLQSQRSVTSELQRLSDAAKFGQKHDSKGNWRSRSY